MAQRLGERIGILGVLAAVGVLTTTLPAVAAEPGWWNKPVPLLPPSIPEDAYLFMEDWRLWLLLLLPLLLVAGLWRLLSTAIRQSPRDGEETTRRSGGKEESNDPVSTVTMLSLLFAAGWVIVTDLAIGGGSGPLDPGPNAPPWMVAWAVVLGILGWSTVAVSIVGLIVCGVKTLTGRYKA